MAQEPNQRFVDRISTLEEFKKTKFHTVLMQVVATAVYPNNYSESGQFKSGFTVTDQVTPRHVIENEHYKFAFFMYNHNVHCVHIELYIKRPGNDYMTEMVVNRHRNNSDVKGEHVEIFNYMKDIYNSDQYAFGKWVKAMKKSWDDIEGI